MSKYEQEIENAVALRGTITVRDLSRMLGVSDQTIRRIVRPLVESGKLKKVHGAIVGVENPMDAPFQARMQHMRAEKVAIATALASEVNDGDALAIDTGSTSGFVAQALQVRLNLTVVTNSAYVASTLAMRPGNRVFMAGTQLRDHDGAAFDRSAFATIERLRVNKCILSAAQVHPSRGFLAHEQCEADIADAMQGIAEQSYMAVDHSKFAHPVSHATIQLSALPENSTVVTNKTPDPSFDKALRNLRLIVTESL